MQYPQIQFYRGSLVRLANGQLKQVEDLSSDDFIESARLAASASNTPKLARQHPEQPHASLSLNRSTLSLSSAGAGGAHHDPRNRFNFRPAGGAAAAGRHGGSSGHLDENNNSVFNSPEPTSASYDDSPTRMDIEEDEDEEEREHEDEDDVELDVVTNDDEEQHLRAALASGASQSTRNMQHVSELVNSDAGATLARRSLDGAKRPARLHLDSSREAPPEQLADFYVGSSVVRDLLEVAPIQEELMSGGGGGGSTRSSSSSSGSSAGGSTGPNSQQPADAGSPTSSSGSRAHRHAFTLAPKASTSGLSPHAHSSWTNQASVSPSAMPQITSAAPAGASQTVLIKFFLETSRSIAFIEVPIEQPFFVLHRGWSSWNPQMTYETFGLKCRKLKIGDTCISLIRRRPRQTSAHNESDQCNILFSSINISE